MVLNCNKLKSYFHKINLLRFEKICLSQNKIYSSILILVEGNQFQKHFIEFWGRHLQLRDPKNDFIFNFNFNDKMKSLWTVWISCKINQHYWLYCWEDELSKCSLKTVQVARDWAKTCSETYSALVTLNAKFKLFKDCSFYHRSTSFEQSSSSFKLAVFK